MIGSLSVDSYITSLILAMSLVGPISRITELIDNVSVLKQSEKKNISGVDCPGVT